MSNSGFVVSSEIGTSSYTHGLVVTRTCIDDSRAARFPDCCAYVSIKSLLHPVDESAAATDFPLFPGRLVGAGVGNWLCLALVFRGLRPDSFS
jgi:hypothetical protein